MIRITKLTDYGILLLSHIAREPQMQVHNVRDLAAEAHLPLPTVSKILKILAREGLLVSHRGVKGGYHLARRPEEISVAEIIGALDGPIAVTDCSPNSSSRCDLEQLCCVRSNWQRINLAVRDTLEAISLADMIRPLPSGFSLVNKTHTRKKIEVLELCPR